ncbi:tetratricopeptide repeat protein [Fulvivirgaceae bacterium LMO-SS25]
MRAPFLTVFICVVLSIPFQSIGQAKLDSLLTVLPTQKNFDKLQTLNNLVYEYAFFDMESAEFYGKQAYELASNLGNDSAKIETMNYFGIALIAARKFDEALEILENAKNQAEEKGYKKALANAFNNLGRYYHAQSNFPIALEHFILAKDVREEIGDSLGLAASYNNLGVIELQQGNYEQTREYLEKAYFFYLKTGDLERSGTTLNNIGNLYRDQGSLEKAIEAYLEGISILEKVGKYHELGITERNLAVALAQNGELERALEYARKALDFRRSGSNDNEKISTLNTMGNIMLRMGELDSALILLKEAEELIVDNTQNALYLDISKNLADTYANMGEYYQGFLYMEKAFSLKDSVNSAEKQKALQEMKNRFELEKYQEELALLNLESESQQNSIRRLFIISLAVGSLVIILVILLYFLFRSSNQKKRLNDELQLSSKLIERQRNSLIELNKEKDYFLRIVAHDIANQLANIKGLLTLMEHEKNDGADRSELAHYCERIGSITGNMILMVRKVLDVRNLDLAVLVPDMKSVNVNDLIKDLILSYKEKARSKNIEIIVPELSNKESIISDPQFLMQAMDNLLNNAIKFSPVGSKVGVYIQKNSNITISVFDEGPGIPPSEVDRLFEKYSKLSAKPTAGEDSNGLGLSIVRKYVTVLGGRVWQENRPEGGSVFKIELPY